MMKADDAERKSIYWICVLALFTAALANAVRAGAAGAIKAGVLDPLDAAHSGELIGAVLGNSFLGFALSLLVISPLLDRIGAKRVILFASACFTVGPLLVLLAPRMGEKGCGRRVLAAQGPQHGVAIEAVQAPVQQHALICMRGQRGGGLVPAPQPVHRVAVHLQPRLQGTAQRRIVSIRRMRMRGAYGGKMKRS